MLKLKQIQNKSAKGWGGTWAVLDPPVTNKNTIGSILLDTGELASGRGQREHCVHRRTASSLSSLASGIEVRVNIVYTGKQLAAFLH